MDETRYHLELNLQKISMVSTAAKLWNAVAIKEEMKTHYLEMKNQDKKDRYKCWSSIRETVLHYLNVIDLPSCLLAELTETIMLIGEKIYHWIFYVTETLKLDFIFCEKMYWTSYGIDEVKIFNCYWREILSTKDFRTNPDGFKHSIAFSLACMFGCDSFINDHVNEMTEELGNFYPSISLTTDKIYNIMSLYICSHLGESFDNHISRPLNMFKLCAYAGFSKAAKFYWTKLNETEKNSDLFCFVMKHYNCVRAHCDCHESFIYEKSCEILYFLISQLSEEKIPSLFAVDGDKVVQTFLSVSPYHELILNLLDYDWELDCYRLMKLFCLILEWKEELRESKCHFLDELYYQIVKLICDKFSEKEKLFFEHRYYGELFTNMVLNSDFRTLNLVMKDSVIGGKFAGVVYEEVVIASEVLVDEGNFTAVDELIEKVFNSNSVLKDSLKKMFSSIATSLVEENKLDIANQFLNWLSDSDEEKVRLKSEIDASSVCFKLTGGSLYGFKLADNFLKWRFETEADVRNFKEGIKSYCFITTEKEDCIRIKSGDLSDLKLGDLVLYYYMGIFKKANSEGFTFVQFEDVEADSILSVIFIFPGTRFLIKFARTLFRCRGDSSIVTFIGIKPGDFILNGIIKIWNFFHNNESVVVDASNAFIKFYYETDEEVMHFKNTTLKSLLRFHPENLVQFVFHNFFLRFNALDAFLNFCLKSPSETNEIKIKIREEIEKLLNVDPVSQIDEKFTNFCIKLYCHIAGEDKKTPLIEKLFNSSDKAALLQ